MFNKSFLCLSSAICLLFAINMFPHILLLTILNFTAYSNPSA